MSASLEDIVRAWFTVATYDPNQETTNGLNRLMRPDPFFRFIAIWVAFNALETAHYSATKGKLPSRDRQLLEHVFADDEAKCIPNSLLKDEGYQRAISALSTEPVRDLKQAGRKTGEARCYSIDQTKSLKSVMECVYQVRNNLFHEGKLPYDVGNPRDKKLVEASYEIVCRLVDQLLKESSMKRVWSEVARNESMYGGRYRHGESPPQRLAGAVTARPPPPRSPH